MVFHVDDRAYDRFMGRYSVPLAPLFVEFARVKAGGRILDVGAGPGALAACLAGAFGAENVAAVEPSPEFVAALERRLPDVDVREAPAEALPWEAETFDAALAQLAISFVTDAPAAVAEMRRVVRPDGVVGLCMWADDGLELSPPLRAAREAAAPHVPPPRPLPYRNRDALAGLLADGGLRDVETATLEVVSEYVGFDEFWEVATAMTGPDTEWTRDLGEAEMAAGREAAFRALGSPAGPFTLRGRAEAARGLR